MPRTFTYGKMVERANGSNGNGHVRQAQNRVYGPSSHLPMRLFSNRYGYGTYGASQSKVALEAWKAASASADEDIIYNLPLLRVRSRDLFMGSPIAGAAVLTLQDNVIGEGLTPIPKINGKVLGLSNSEAAERNEEIKEEFSLFADTVECDWNRRNTFYELTRLAFVNMVISGDVLGLLPLKERRGAVYNTKIRLLEADRVASPDVTLQYDQDYVEGGLVRTFGGVELTDDGEVEAYWISPYHPGSKAIETLEPDDFTRIPAFGEETGKPLAMLVAEMERPEQRRGVPFMSKCLTELKQIQRYVESTTIQNVIKSYFTAFIESALPSSDMFDRLIDDDDLDDLVTRNEYNVKLGPAIINWMRPGDKINFPIGAGPDKEFEPYVVAICKFIGSCLGIPYEILLKQFNASYSASRAALLEFWRRVRVLRRLIINQWCRPIYCAWMMEAISEGVWDAPGFFEDPRVFQAWTKCIWRGDSPGSIDPLKEIIASEKRVKLGVSTLEMESLEINGSDWRANTIQQGIECHFSTENGLTYIRNLDVRGIPIQSLGINEDLLLQEDE
ncbi:MAG TPA: phage portal protein [Bacteroidia bacterium]|jgi:lambda family phage portal protein|nr:phage portal protein [Bacteroidia bacterium]